MSGAGPVGVGPVGTRSVRNPWSGRRVLLGVSGGIAAYKIVQVARDLTQLGAAVDVVMTRGAQEFVGPMSFQGVTGRPVHLSLWDVDSAALHIRLGLEADVVLLAPATADLMARLAGGRADDLLSTTLLVTRAPVVVAPAMNDRMWSHPRTRANAETLQSMPGWRLVGPDTGPLAVGEGEGPGRMVSPERLVLETGRALSGTSALQGQHVLITAGPTREPLDSVRFLGNRSSGRMGLELAVEAWLRGARVTVVLGPGTLVEPDLPADSFAVERVESARDMLDATLEHARNAPVQIFAAAVSDYRPNAALDRKRKRNEGDWSLELTENPDVALESAKVGPEGVIRVGFALETDDLESAARSKMEAKDFDLVVANPAGETDAGFESTTNRGLLLVRGERDAHTLSSRSKADMASDILDAVELRLGGGGSP